MLSIFQKYKTWWISTALIASVSLLVLLLVISVTTKNFVEQLVPVSKAHVFHIQQGESAKRVLANLNKQFPLGNLFASRLWFKLNPDLAQFKAGIYELVPGDSVASIFHRFHSGQTKKVTVTLVEGQTWREWQEQLSNIEWLTPDIANDTLLNHINTLSSWQLSNAEGVLMPDTYQVEAGSSSFELVRVAAKKMQEFIASEWENRQSGLPLASPYEALILASIIEKETGVAHERPHIASVFVNRLNKGMRLQTDPTVIYGIGEEFDGNITRAHLREKTPYNTYRINGLPPTPIAMPGRASIVAALHPLQTDDLYFVSKGDGSHQFSETLKEHNAAVRRYQLGKN